MHEEQEEEEQGHAEEGEHAARGAPRPTAGSGAGAGAAPAVSAMQPSVQLHAFAAAAPADAMLPVGGGGGGGSRVARERLAQQPPQPSGGGDKESATVQLHAAAGAAAPAGNARPHSEAAVPLSRGRATGHDRSLQGRAQASHYRALKKQKAQQQQAQAQAQQAQAQAQQAQAQQTQQERVDAAWSNTLLELRDFLTSTHGRYPRRHHRESDAAEKRLALWVQRQRSARRGKGNCLMTQERALLLESLDGWQWDEGASPPPRAPGSCPANHTRFSLFFLWRVWRAAAAGHYPKECARSMPRR